MNSYYYQKLFPISYGYVPNLTVAPKMEKAFEEARAFLQAPDGMILACQLTSMATAMQGVFNVEIPTRKIAPVSLMVMTIAQSGERKSTVDNLFMGEIKSIEKEQEAVYQKSLKDYNIQMDIHKEKKAKLKKTITLDNAENEQTTQQLVALSEQEPTKPRAPRVIYEDTTSEALLDGLKNDLPNVFFGSSEGDLIFKSRVMSNSANFNPMWSGDDMTVNRKTSPSFKLNDIRLSMHIMVQPDTLQNFLNKSNVNVRDNGFLSRMLVCEPLSTCGFRQANGHRHSREGIEEFNCRIRQLLEQSLGLVDYRHRQKVVFSSAAEKVWWNIYNDIETKMAPGGMYACARDHASKLSENIARVAALIHCFEHPDDFEISLESLWLAVELLSYFSNDFMRVFCPPPKYVLDACALNEWLKPFAASGIRYIRKNYILQYGPNCIRKKADLQAVLDYIKQSNPMAEIMIDKTRVMDLFCDLPPDNAKLAENLAHYS
ncbi:YfjI family protein [Shewanella sp. SP2S2-4]|uniref:YfjI family protein n=1 Tax=Shewanella TaxID=22 RepID=UPI00288D66CB|nr:YfjI family protein [Shewanella sp. SP2S2-4]MDT3272895.1 YfjI family protein [Shewanella sp. SP2S2-4]